MTDKISFVLPLTASCAYTEGSDLQRVKHGLLPSIIKYFNNSQIDRFLIIASAGECTEIENSLAEFREKINLSIINKERIFALVPGYKMHMATHKILDFLRLLRKRLHHTQYQAGLANRLKLSQYAINEGWYSQQIVKLLAAKLINTDYYITLDADMCLTRAMDLKDIFLDGKAVYSKEPLSNHYDWWLQTSKLLDIGLKLKRDDYGMAATCQILHVKIAADLLSHLSRKAKEKKYLSVFDYFSMNPGWTEYTLYWLFLSEFYSKESYYIDRDDINLTHLDYNIWVKQDAPTLDSLRERIKLAFKDTRGFFLIVQSRVVSTQDYLQVIKKYF